MWIKPVLTFLVLLLLLLIVATVYCFLLFLWISSSPFLFCMIFDLGRLCFGSAYLRRNKLTNSFSSQMVLQLDRTFLTAQTFSITSVILCATVMKGLCQVSLSGKYTYSCVFSDYSWKWWHNCLFSYLWKDLDNST